MVNKRKSSRRPWAAAAVVACCLPLSMAQIELAPANLGLKLTPPDGYVKAVPGRNPNMPPWFEDLGVESFGQILGHTSWASVEAEKAAPQAPTDFAPLLDPRDGNGLVSAGDAQGILKAEDGDVGSTSSSASSEKGSEHGSDSWEVIDLRNSTEAAGNKTEAGGQDAEPSAHIKVLGIPYPKEEPIEILDAHRGEFVDDWTLVPPPEQLATEPFMPKAKRISLWRPQAQRPDPPPLFILPPDNPERIVTTFVDMLQPIVATSTYTTKVSGSLVTSTTVSTIDQKAMRFKSCIYGCPEMTSSDSLVGTTTIITVLPLQIPCSLVSCPPCPACFQSTIKVSVCPFIATVPAKARTTVVNGPTITVVRSTVTRTACTATRTISLKAASPPSVSTETVTVTVSHGGARSSSSGSAAASAALLEGNDASDEGSERTPFVDPALILGGSGEDTSPAKNIVHIVTGADLRRIQAAPAASTITDTVMSTVYATASKHTPSLTITKTVVSEHVVLTVTTTVLPVTTTVQSEGICSTFIICNPTQFTCPAQVTNLPQIKAVVQAIMEGREKYGAGGAGSRRLTPNGAYIDDMGPPSLFGDGAELAGGLNPVNRFGFGPGGMFEKVLGPELIAPRDTTTETLLPPKPTESKSAETSASAAQAKLAPSDLPLSSTRVVEAMTQSTDVASQARRTSIKRGQASASAPSVGRCPALSALAALLLYHFM